MATVKYVLKLDDQLSKGLATTAANVHAVVAALRELDAQAKGVEGAMAGTGRASQVTAEQAKDAAAALGQMAQSAGLTAEQSEKLTKASQRAGAAASKQREEAKKQREEARRAAAVAKMEARERDKLSAALEKQREAHERVAQGKETAEALKELRSIDALIKRLKERNELTEEELRLLNERKKQVRENLAIETGRARELGTRIDRGFGARGTRRSPIAGGVFSTHVKNATLSMKDASAAARSLGQQLPDVISQLAAGANPAQVFAQQGLQVAQTVDAQTGLFGKLLPLLARMGPVLGAVGLGFLALGTVGIAAANAMDKANDAAGRFNERLDASINRLRKYREEAEKANGVLVSFRRRAQDAETDAAVARGDLSTESGELVKLERGIRRQADEHRLALEKVASEARDAIEKAERNGLRGAESARTLGRATPEQVETIQKHAEAVEALADAEAKLARLDKDTDRIIDAESDKLLAQVEKEREEKRKRDAEKAEQDEERQARKREQHARERAASLDRLAKMARQSETAHLSDVQKVNAAMEDRLAIIKKLGESLGSDEQGRAAVERAEKAVRADAAAQTAKIEADKRDAANEEAAKAAIAAQEAAQGLREALDVLSGEIRRDGLGSLLGGDVSGAIEAGLGRGLQLAGKGATAAGAAGAGFGLGLAAAPVAAGVVGLKTVGDLGADGVDELAEKTVDAIVAGIEALPEILVQVAPKLGVAIATEIVPALLKLPVLFAIALGEAIRDLFTRGRERRQDRRERRRESRAEGRARRSFRSGTSIVQRDGPAMLHQGELVVPVSGAVSQDGAARVRRQAEAEAGGGVRIRPVTIDAIVMGVSSPQTTGPWSHWAGFGPKLGGNR